MAEAKPLASLTSGLLARKGQAAPAMRRQSMMLHAPEPSAPGNHNPLEDLGWNDMGDEQSPVRQATGLSPMPSATPAPVAALMPIPMPMPMPVQEAILPEPPVVVRQQEELARELAKPVEEEIEDVVEEFAPVAEEPVVQEAVVEAPVVVAPAPRQPVVRAAPGSKGKAAFTLRLDGDRHLKLRLVCAVNHRSAQQIVTQALDEFLARQPSVEQLMAGSGAVN
jgi:hypothetical protein